MSYSHENTNIIKFKSIISPSIIKDELPINDKIIENIINYRNSIVDILNNRDERKIIITGPCSIHDYDAAIEYAIKLKQLSNKFPKLFIIMRVYFEKPRTTIGWKGFVNDPDLDYTYNINKGLRLARKLLIEISEMELPIGCEFLDTITPQYLSDLVSWGAIGARTVESQTHRELASGLSVPMGFKNGTGGTIQIAMDAIIAANNKHCFLGITDEGTSSIITTKGNKNCHIILRGGTNGPNYHKEKVDYTIQELKKNNINSNIIVDCSHGNSQKDYKKQICVAQSIAEQISNGNNSIIGIMLESNLVEGNQKCSHKKDCLTELTYGKSITDSCINLTTTEEIFELFTKNILSSDSK